MLPPREPSQSEMTLDEARSSFSKTMSDHAKDLKGRTRLPIRVRLIRFAMGTIGLIVLFALTGVVMSWLLPVSDILMGIAVSVLWFVWVQYLPNYCDPITGIPRLSKSLTNKKNPASN